MKGTKWIVGAVVLAVVGMGLLWGQAWAASTLQTKVAAAGEIILTSEISITDIKLTNLATVTVTLGDNALTKRAYTYRVALYVDGALKNEATTQWTGLFDSAVIDFHLVPLLIPEGQVWSKLTVVVTP